MDIQLNIGNIISFSKTKYRIISIIDSCIILCQMNTGRLILTVHDYKNILSEIILKNCDLIKDEEKPVIDPNLLSVPVRKKLELDRQILNEIDSAFGPTYMDLTGHREKAGVKTILNNYPISKATFWRIVTKYLQSGFDPYSVIDNRYFKTHERKDNRTAAFGRKRCTLAFDNFGNRKIIKSDPFIPGEHDIKNMAEASKKYLSDKSPSIVSAWHNMNLLHYSTIVQKTGGNEIKLIDESQRPSLRSFRYFVKTHTTIQERTIAKSSAMEFRNNKRILKSDTRNGIMGPGFLCEVDEVEFDCYIVDSITRQHNIGKAIGYCMIDVDTRQIIAQSTQLDNNATLGITNCLLNLSDDKVSYCKRFGINITPDDWFSYLPLNLRSDQGSEYTANEFKRICGENNINPQLVSPGTGSLKPLIEQSFHQIMSRQLSELRSQGWYKKKYGDMCKQEACLTIEDFTKLVINFIIEHNKSYMKSYRRTHDQIKANMQPCPNEIYKTDCKKFGYPRTISNLMQFYYSVMYADRAVITRNGIVYKDLIYYDDNNIDLKQRIYNAQNKRIPIDIRIDPRDIYAVFYVNSDGDFVKVPINKDIVGNDYSGYTLQEYEQLLDEKKELDRKGAVLNDNLRANRHYADMQVINGINPKTFASTDNIKENREQSRQQFNNNNSIRNRIEPTEDKQPASISKSNEQEHTIDMPDKDEEELTLREINRRINYGIGKDE